MSAKFYTLLTDIGAAKLASAAALGVPLKITQMAVGDGGGVLPTPSAQQTALVAEKRRASLNMLYIDPQNSSQIIAEQVIPETEGGWWIREVGLFDDTGAMIAVGNCPESYKPQLAEGSGRTQTVRMVLITSSTDNITLKIDPAVVLATRKYVDDKAIELKLYVDDAMTNHIKEKDPHTQYAKKESPTFTGTPKSPTASKGDNSKQLANTEFVSTAVSEAQKENQPLNAKLTAIAGLVGGENKLAYFTDKDKASQTDLSQVGRDIIGKGDVAEVLKYLGLGTAAKKDVGTSTGQLPSMDSFTSGSNSTAFWYGFPNGMVLMGGNAAEIKGGVSGNGINFPVPFPNTCSVVIPVLVNVGLYGTGPVSFNVNVDSKSRFSVYTTNTASAVTIFWLAFGS